MRRQWQPAINAATAALELYRETSDDAGIAAAYWGLSRHRLHLGQYTEARANAEAACTHAEAAGNAALHGRSLSTLAALLPGGERLSVVERAARLLSEAGDYRAMAELYSNAAFSVLVEDGPEEAIDLLDKALAAAEKLRTPAATRMIVLSNMGLARLLVGNANVARTAFVEALKLCTTEAFRWGGAESLAGLTAVLVVEGEPERGAQLLGAAKTAGYPGPDPYDQAMLDRLERDYFDHARSRLTPCRWTQLTRTGAEFSFDQAVGFALAAAASLDHAADAAADDIARP